MEVQFVISKLGYLVLLTYLVLFICQNDLTIYHPCRAGIWSPVVFRYRLTNQLSGCNMHTLFLIYCCKGNLEKFKQY